VYGYDDISYQMGEKMFKLCKKRGEEGKALPKGICATLQDMVEDTIDSTGNSMASVFGKSITESGKKAFSNPFHKTQGKKILNDVLDWLIAEKITTKRNWIEEVKLKFGQAFFQWWKNVLDADSVPKDKYYIPPETQILGGH